MVLQSHAIAEVFSRQETVVSPGHIIYHMKNKLALPLVNESKRQFFSPQELSVFVTTECLLSRHTLNDALFVYVSVYLNENTMPSKQKNCNVYFAFGFHTNFIMN